MDNTNDLIKVGKFNTNLNRILDTQIQDLDIYRSKGLPSHMLKRKHYKSLKYIDYIPEIIQSPDYVGINPNETGLSVEMIKIYDDNMLIGIKLNADGEYLYVSTMHDIQESKIQRRLHSGRLKKINT